MREKEGEDEGGGNQEKEEERNEIVKSTRGERPFAAEVSSVLTVTTDLSEMRFKDGAAMVEDLNIWVIK